jgi:hypothetical protein
LEDPPEEAPEEPLGEPPSASVVPEEAEGVEAAGAAVLAGTEAGAEAAEAAGCAAATGVSDAEAGDDSDSGVSAAAGALASGALAVCGRTTRSGPREEASSVSALRGPVALPTITPNPSSRSTSRPETHGPGSERPATRELEPAAVAAAAATAGASSPLGARARASSCSSCGSRGPTCSPHSRQYRCVGSTGEPQPAQEPGAAISVGLSALPG